MREDRSFRGLEVWKNAVKLATKIYSVTALLPEAEKFGLVSQMRRSVVSISSNIAEGYGRRSGPEIAHFLRISRGSCYELLSQSEVCLALGLIPDETLEDLESDIGVVVAQINGLIKYKESRVEEELADYDLNPKP